jgi:hypothetical protein
MINNESSTLSPAPISGTDCRSEDQPDHDAQSHPQDMDVDLPHSSWPPLLVETANLIGSSAGIDRQSAAFLTLSVVGAIAGPIHLTVPGEGIFTPTVSTLIVGGKGIRLALTFLVDDLERLLASILCEFQNLSDGTLITHEIRRTEGLLRTLREQSGPWRATLDKVRRGELDEKNFDVIEARQNYGALAPRETQVETQLSRLRLLRRPLLLVPFLGAQEIRDWDKRTFDGQVLELGTEPGILSRLRSLSLQELKLVGAFRRNLEWGGHLSYGDGRLRLKPALSSLWVVEEGELEEAKNDPLLHLHRLFDTFALIRPRPYEGHIDVSSDQGRRWSDLTTSLLSARIGRETPDKELGPGALTAISEAQNALPDHLHTLLVRLALCSALVRDPAGDVQVDDVLTALDLADHAKDPTTRLRAGAGSPKKSAVPNDAATSLEVFLTRLRKHGPCSRRTLVRCYSNCDYVTLETMINRAKALDLVVERGKKLQIVGVEMLVPPTS